MSNDMKNALQDVLEYVNNVYSSAERSEIKRNWTDICQWAENNYSTEEFIRQPMSIVERAIRKIVNISPPQCSDSSGFNFLEMPSFAPKSHNVWDTKFAPIRSDCEEAVVQYCTRDMSTMARTSGRSKKIIDWMMNNLSYNEISQENVAEAVSMTCEGVSRDAALNLVLQPGDPREPHKIKKRILELKAKIKKEERWMEDRLRESSEYSFNGEYTRAFGMNVSAKAGLLARSRYQTELTRLELALKGLE